MLKLKMRKKSPKPPASCIPGWQPSQSTLTGSVPDLRRQSPLSMMPREAIQTRVRPAGERLSGLGGGSARAKNLPKLPLLETASLIRRKTNRAEPARFYTRRVRTCRASNPIHVLLHRLFLLFDGFDQFELRAAAVEVVAGPMDAEISVAAQEIRQESDADFERDEFAGKGDVRLSRLWSEIGRRWRDILRPVS